MEMRKMRPGPAGPGGERKKHGRGDRGEGGEGGAQSDPKGGGLKIKKEARPANNFERKT